MEDLRHQSHKTHPDGVRCWLELFIEGVYAQPVPVLAYYHFCQEEGQISYDHRTAIHIDEMPFDITTMTRNHRKVARGRNDAGVMLYRWHPPLNALFAEFETRASAQLDDYENDDFLIGDYPYQMTLHARQAAHHAVMHEMDGRYRRLHHGGDGSLHTPQNARRVAKALGTEAEIRHRVRVQLQQRVDWATSIAVDPDSGEVVWSDDKARFLFNWNIVQQTMELRPAAEEPGNADLRDLRVRYFLPRDPHPRQAAISPEFDPETLTYSALVPHNAIQISVQPVVDALGASITASAPQGPMPVYGFLVLSPNRGTQKFYQITVNREEET